MNVVLSGFLEGCRPSRIVSFVLMLEVKVVVVLRWNVFFVEVPPVDPALLLSCGPLRSTAYHLVCENG